MNEHSNPLDMTNFTRELLIGLGEKSVKKNYYPELQKRVEEIQRFHLLLDQATDAIFLVNFASGKIIDANAVARKCSNFTSSAVDNPVISSCLQCIIPTTELSLQEYLKSLSSPTECLLIINDGDAIPVEVSANLVTLDNATYIVIVARDISERKASEENLRDAHEELHANYEELEALYGQISATEECLRIKVTELEESQQSLLISESRYHLAIDGSNDAIWEWDIPNNCLLLSEHWISKLGLPTDHVNNIDDFWVSRIHPDDYNRRLESLNKHLAQKTDYYEAEYRLKIPSGHYVWLLAKGKALFDSSGKPIRMAGSFTDITTRKIQEKRLNHLAFHDSLTDLPNRISFYDSLTYAVTRSRLLNQTCAIFILDLDNFKYINDSLGHAAGDELLIEVAHRLQRFLPPETKIARQSGDEFSLFINTDSKTDIQYWAEQLLSLFDEPAFVGNTHVAISCSIGVASYAPGLRADDLLRNADTALHEAKATGKKNWRMYKQEMQTALLERIKMENELHQALANNEFVLYYQPQIEASTGNTIAFEALIRWNHKSKGLIAPQTFIPLAEETGLIISIGDWVLRTACRFGLHLQHYFSYPIRIAVNVSARQLMQDDFTQRVKRILLEENYPASQLELELTESMLIESFEVNVRNLDILRKLGIRIALDDFGTGYSSLTYLSQLPIDVLKIDKTFLDQMQNNPTRSAIVGTIIRLAHQLNLSVVAEGVEIKEQLCSLQDWGCDYIQGYYISHPLPSDKAVKFEYSPKF